MGLAGEHDGAAVGVEAYGQDAVAVAAHRQVLVSAEVARVTHSRSSRISLSLAGSKLMTAPRCFRLKR
jgi:hypothetical protein